MYIQDNGNEGDETIAMDSSADGEDDSI